MLSVTAGLEGLKVKVFRLRIIYGSLLIVFIAAALLLDQWLGGDVAFTILFGLFAVIATREIFDMTRQHGHTPFSTLGTMTVAALVAAYWLDNTFVGKTRWVYIIAFLFIMGLFLCQAFLSPRQAGLVSMSLTVFAVFYVWVLGGFIQRLNSLDGIGLRCVLVFLVTVKIADMGGYAVGKSLGRHHPFKTLSPAKTTEGYAAGLVLSIAAGVTCGLLLLEGFAWYHWVGFGALMWFFGSLGDLFESVIKRDLDVKDSASLIPGLGGVFDQLDSVLLAGPAAYIMLTRLVQ